MRENTFSTICDYYTNQNCINNKCDALEKLYEIYDKTSIIEWELIMCALDEIVYTALHLK